MKPGAFLGPVAGVLFLLAACGDRPASLTFAVGGTPSELLTWEEIAADFQRDTGVALAIRRMPADSSQQQQSLLVALNSRQPDPDVFLMDVAWVGVFIAARWLQPLANIDRDAFFASVIEKVDMRNGRLLALPVYLDAGLLYYRTDLLEMGGLTEPPRTWKELVDSSIRVQRRLRGQDPAFYGFVWQGAQYEGLVVNFMEFAGSQGGFVVEKRRVRVDLRANEAALALMRDCIWRHSISPPSAYTEMREEESRAYFQAGRALYERNWPYAWALHQQEDSPVRGKVGVAQLPAPEDGGPASALGGYHVGVSAFSDIPAGAQRFASYITSAAVQKTLTLRLGWNPGRRDLYEDAEILERNPHFERLKDVFRNARPRPVTPHYSQISRLLQRRLSAVLARKTDPETALSEAQQAIERLENRYGFRPKN